MSAGKTQFDAFATGVNTPASSLRALRERLIDRFVDRGFTYVDPPILEAPEPFLERSGEEIRQRMYAFLDPSGREVCLRPEMTIPACRLFLELRETGRFDASDPAHLCYAGPVFRHEQDRAVNGGRRRFTQAGVEVIGGKDPNATDTQILGLAVESVREAGVTGARVVVGDAAVLLAFLDSLDVGERSRNRLARHIRRVHSVDDVLREFGTRRYRDHSADFLGIVSRLGVDDCRAFVEEMLELTDVRPVGARTAEEIAERLADKAADVPGGEATRAIAHAVIEFLSIAGAPEECAERAARLAREIGSENLDAALERFVARTKKLASTGLTGDQYTVDFGLRRGLEYYTGFVFEISVDGVDTSPISVSGGGRYDRLLKMLGAPSDIPAVGFALDLETLLAASNSGVTR